MQWSDAWLLHAISLAAREEPAPLEVIIAAADYVNHAILTFAEVSCGLGRLIRNGFIRDVELRFAPTPEFLAVYEEIAGKARYVHQIEDAVADAIHAQAWQPGTDPNALTQGDQYPAMTREIYDAAVQEYLRHFRSSSPRSGKPRRHRSLSQPRR